MSHVMACEVCGAEFEAKRSDALTCGNVCRQERHRQKQDYVRAEPPEHLRKGQWKRTKVDLMNNLVDHAAGEWYMLREGLRLTDVQGAIDSPDAPLAEWDKELTGMIRVLTRLRRAIRDTQRA